MKRHTSLLLLSTIASVSAQDFLDPLVITATRSSTALGDVPYSGTYFSSEDFSKTKSAPCLTLCATHPACSYRKPPTATDHLSYAASPDGRTCS